MERRREEKEGVRAAGGGGGEQRQVSGRSACADAPTPLRPETHRHGGSRSKEEQKWQRRGRETKEKEKRETEKKKRGGAATWPNLGVALAGIGNGRYEGRPIVQRRSQYYAPHTPVPHTTRIVSTAPAQHTPYRPYRVSTPQYYQQHIGLRAGARIGGVGGSGTFAACRGVVCVECRRMRLP
eukprot:3081664-Rhodomonas_salina.1